MERAGGAMDSLSELADFGGACMGTMALQLQLPLPVPSSDGLFGMELSMCRQIVYMFKVNTRRHPGL